MKLSDLLQTIPSFKIPSTFFSDLKTGDIVTIEVIKAIAENKTLININGNTVTAETKIALKPGEIIKAFVQDKEPFLILRAIEASETGTDKNLIKMTRNFPPATLDIGKVLLDINKILKSADKNLPPAFFSDLKKGDIVTIEVTKSIAENKTLININGNTIATETKIALKPGEIIKAFVQDKEPFLILRAIEESEGSIDKNLIKLIRNFPLGTLNIGKTLLDINQILKTTDKNLQLPLSGHVLEEQILSGGGKELASKLTEIIKSSGLFFENRLKEAVSKPTDIEGDLKGRLLKLLTLVEGKELENKGVLISKINTLISHIESNQSSNYLGKESGAMQYAQIPYLVSGESKNIHIFVKNFRKQEKAKGKEELFISLLLDLAHLDKLRVDLRANGTNLSLKFFAANEEVKLFLQDHLQTLKEVLTKEGYSADIEFNVSRQEYINEFINDKGFISDEFRSLDVTA